MAVSELYKVLEVLVKENPQGLIYRIYWEDSGIELERIRDAEVNEDGDLVLA